MKIRSEVFLREDVQAILQGLTLTAYGNAGHNPRATIELSGFLRAVTAVALALHIPPDQVLPARVTVTALRAENTELERTVRSWQLPA